MRDWTLRNIKENTLPRDQLRTIDESKDRRLHDFRTLVDDTMLCSVDGPTQRQMLTMYPRKLKQIKRTQVHEYKAMEDLVSFLSESRLILTLLLY